MSYDDQQIEVTECTLSPHEATWVRYQWRRYFAAERSLVDELTVLADMHRFDHLDARARQC